MAFSRKENLAIEMISCGNSIYQVFKRGNANTPWIDAQITFWIDLVCSLLLQLKLFILQVMWSVVKIGGTDFPHMCLNMAYLPKLICNLAFQKEAILAAGCLHILPL